MIRRPPRSTLFSTRRSSDLMVAWGNNRSGQTTLPTVGGRVVSIADRKSTRLNSSHGYTSYAVFCFKKNKGNELFCIVTPENKHDQYSFSLLKTVLVRFFGIFFFNDTATTEIYTLSLHDALPILIASDGAYAKLWQHQSGGFLDDNS